MDGSERKCWTCDQWQPQKSGAMAKQRFAVCALGPRWTFLSPLNVCERHHPLEAKAVAKRRTWLAAVLNRAPA